MLPYKRSERIAEIVRQRVCDAITDIGAPADAGLITITGVSVSDDLTNANIYYSVFGDQRQRESAQNFLEERGGEIKRYTAGGLQIKKMPEMKFFYDETPEKAARIFSLLEKIKTPPETAPKKVIRRSAPKRRKSLKK